MSTAREYARRRKRLMAEMGEGVAIIPTSPQQRRNRDVEYPYRPDSDFYYLTGFAEPNALAVLAPGRADGEFVLFCHCLLYTSPSPRDRTRSRMPSSA